MKTINVNEIIPLIKEMCINCNVVIASDIKDALNASYKKETSPLGKQILTDLLLNAEIAKSKAMPICQDTGMVVVFVELGQSVFIEGGLLTDAIQEGVRQGYEMGFLRKSIVKDPFLRENTKDNTPAVIHVELVEGDRLKINLAAKGFGSENMSKTAMLKPCDGIEGVKAFVLDTVKQAGSNPCPPIVVGVGIGGTLEKAAILAKKALFRPLHDWSSLPHIKALEESLLKAINGLGIGPAGLGGNTTALGVNINVFPTHIAGLPVAVNINCHASRHLSVEL